MPDIDSIEKLAEYASKYFEQKERAKDEFIWNLRGRRPSWIYDMVRKAHAGMLPDEYKFEYVVAALNSIADGGSPEEIESDVYNSDLLAWLGSHMERAGYVDEEVKEVGHSDLGIMGDIMTGQVGERREVWGHVVNALESRLREIADGEPERFQKSSGKAEGVLEWEPID